jgi:SAM-dependent methyltransferase
MYGADLAAFHDAHATTLAREAATTLVDELAEAGLHRGLVADVGCGSGRLSALLGEAGYDVLAIDPSPAFLEILARVAPRARCQQATVASMRLPAGLVAVACVGEVLSYDLRIDLDEALEAIHDALRPGGVLLLDVPGPGRHGGGRSTTVHDEDGALLVLETEESRLRLTRSITVFTETADGSYRRSSEVHELRLHDPADVRAGLARAGFVAIRALDRYGAAGPPFGDGWVGFVAERP